MSINTQTDEEAQIIHMELKNQSSMDEIQEKLPRILQTIAQFAEPKLLLQYIADDQMPNPQRRAVIGLLAEQLSENIKHVAICCSPKLRVDVSSVSELMIGRGASVQFFTDSDSADTWLRNK